MQLRNNQTGPAGSAGCWSKTKPLKKRKSTTWTQINWIMMWTSIVVPTAGTTTTKDQRMMRASSFGWSNVTTQVKFTLYEFESRWVDTLPSGPESWGLWRVHISSGSESVCALLHQPQAWMSVVLGFQTIFMSKSHVRSNTGNARIQGDVCHCKHGCGAERSLPGHLCAHIYTCCQCPEMDDGLLNFFYSSLRQIVPFMFVGNDAYPWPYEALMIHGQRIVNYRLFTAQEAVENEFSHLRVFRANIWLGKLVKITMASLCIHNFLLEGRSNVYTPPANADWENMDSIV